MWKHFLVTACWWFCWTLHVKAPIFTTNTQRVVKFQQNTYDCPNNFLHWGKIWYKQREKVTKMLVVRMQNLYNFRSNWVLLFLTFVWKWKQRGILQNILIKVVLKHCRVSRYTLAMPSTRFSDSWLCTAFREALKECTSASVQ